MDTDNNIIERIRDIRDQVLEVAPESLKVNDENTYRELSEIAVKLTTLIPRDDAKKENITEQATHTKHDTSSAVNEKIEPNKGKAMNQPYMTSIHAVYIGRRYNAELDAMRINSSGRGNCVLYKGKWVAASGAARLVTEGDVNGWMFWKYRRANGSEGRIQEIREQYIQPDD